MDLTKELIGTWELVDYIYSVDGKESKPLGDKPTGFLMYTNDGYVSAQMMKANRPAYESKDLHTGSKEEMAEAAHGYVAYAGKFEILDYDQESNTVTVTHSMAVSMNPTWLGNTQKRYATYKDGLLTIHADVNEAKIVWRKVG
jgi:hypothetical protein